MDTLHLGLRDVALLARVRRSPVTVWRRRYAESDTPFPAPAIMRGEQSFFDGQEVVSWLEATGRGRNPDAREDLAAFAVLASNELDGEVVFEGLTALLCLVNDTGPLPRDVDGLLAVADDADPDDEYLYREVEALGAQAAPLARYATLLTDAAFNPAAAFETVLVRRARVAGSGLQRTALAEPARHLVAALALALTAHSQMPTPLFVDPFPGSGDLLVEVAALAGERGDVTVATPPATEPAARLALRRIAVHDVPRRSLPLDGQAGVAVLDGAVLMTQFPDPSRPTMSDLEVLRAIEDVVLGSSDRCRAVVIGPASALVERLARPAATVRDDVLRTDRVRGVVRLPSGLLPSATRARLALWCLGPPPAGHADAVPTVVADLSDTALDSRVSADLVTDLMAGMQDARTLAAHAPRIARPVPTRALRARTGALVEPFATTPGPVPAAHLADDIRATTAALAVPVALTDLPAPALRTTEPAATTTLGAAVTRKELRLLPGLRLRDEHLDERGSVRVLGPPELTGESRRAIDRLVLAARYPTAAFTEPGDVVFCTAPRPAARVDEGGAVVVFPARVLRSRTPRLLPRVLAADIDAKPVTARVWRSWTVRGVPDDQAEALAITLDRLARHRKGLAERVRHLDRLADALTHGVTTGALDVTQWT